MIPSRAIEIGQCTGDFQNALAGAGRQAHPFGHRLEKAFEVRRQAADFPHSSEAQRQQSQFFLTNRKPTGSQICLEKLELQYSIDENHFIQVTEFKRISWIYDKYGQLIYVKLVIVWLQYSEVVEKCVTRLFSWLSS